MGVLKWVDWTVSEPRYFQLQTDHTPIHLALLDEVWPRRIADLPNGGCLSLNINPVPHRSARATSCCTRRFSIYSSSSSRRSTASWTSWSRLAFCPLLPLRQRPPRLTLGCISCLPSDGAEEDSAGPHGSPSEPWLRVACCRLHPQMSGEAQHGYLPHPILCHRGNWCETPRNRSWEILDAAGCCWMCKWCSKPIRLCVPRCWMWSLLPTPQTLFSSSCPSWRTTASQERSAQRENTTRWQSSSVRELKFIGKQINASLILVSDASASVSDAHTQYFFSILQLIANPTSSWWTDAEKRPKVVFRCCTLSVGLKSRYRHGNERLRLSAKRSWTTHRSQSTRWMSPGFCWDEGRLFGKYQDTNAPKT